MAPAIVFDIDDTLYLERTYIASGFAAVQRWAQQAAADSPAIACAVEVYRAHIPAIQLLPDARQALDMASATAAVAVISDGPLASQMAKVRALELFRWSSCIICTGALGPAYCKPSKLPFLRVQRTLRVRPEDCCYVADNPHKDFTAPKALGWRTVRVRRSGSLHERCASGPDVDDEVVDLMALESCPKVG